jgi:hypothetical protein
LGVSLQENFLCRLLDQTLLAEEAAGEAEDARAVAADDLFKSAVIPCA